MGFALEPLSPFLKPRRRAHLMLVLPDEFDCCRSAQELVLCGPDFPHTSNAEPMSQLVSAELSGLAQLGDHLPHHFAGYRGDECGQHVRDGGHGRVGGPDSAAVTEVVSVDEGGQEVHGSRSQPRCEHAMRWGGHEQRID